MIGSWFYQQDIRVQAALLADPHGYLPEGVAPLIPGHVLMVYWVQSEGPRRWQLQPAEAAALADECRRLDEWWRGLSEDARAAIVEHRADLVPGEYRSAVGTLMPGGATVADDLVGPFRLPPMVVAYAEMIAQEGAA